MDELEKLATGPNTSLFILAFLHQTDCRNTEYRRELQHLGSELNVNMDMNSNGPWTDTLEDGELESDGHLPSNVRLFLGDIRPVVDMHWHVNHEAEAIQEVAAELREIAAQLEHSIVARATQNLGRNLLNSSPHMWRDHLVWEVERLMSRGVGLEQLPHERVIVALTLTLVKGVCEQAPRLLRNVFYAALQYISSVMTR